MDGWKALTANCFTQKYLSRKGEEKETSQCGVGVYFFDKEGWV